MQNKYEIITIISPEEKENIEDVQKKVDGIISGHSGEILKKEDWGMKSLPYTVDKFNFGYFIFMLVSMPGDQIASLKRDLKLAAEVIRFSVYIPNEEA